jgi:hypothetical protein
MHPGREADHLLPNSSEVKNTWIYMSTTPIRLHDVVLNQLSIGKNLLIPIYLSMALQPFVGPWPLFQFLNPIHSL